MDLWFIFGGIVLLIGLALFGVRAAMQTAIKKPVHSDYPEGYSGARQFQDDMAAHQEAEQSRTGVKIFANFLLGIAAILLFMSTFVIIPANTVGIEVRVGQPVGANDNGWTWKNPISRVVYFEGARQYLRFGGKGNDESAASDTKQWPSIPVRMTKEAKADITVTVGWQMKATTETQKLQAIEQFRNFKTFDRLTENYMAANARQAAQTTYDNVNPLVTDQNVTYTASSEKMLTELRKLVGSEIEIISVQVTNADYDDKTDESIKNMQAEFAKTALAEQQKLTNEAASRANAALVQSLSDQILKDNCIKGAIAAGQNPGPCLQPGWGGAAGQSATPGK